MITCTNEAFLERLTALVACRGADRCEEATMRSSGRSGTPSTTANRANASGSAAVVDASGWPCSTLAMPAN